MNSKLWRKPLSVAAISLCIWALGYMLLYWQREAVPNLSRPQLTGTQPISLPHLEQIGFLAVGRQGYGNQWAAEVAAGMERSANETAADFVVLTGDNFHPNGVTSVTDPQWLDKFEQLYNGPALMKVPFFAVAGNHDHRGDMTAQLDYSREHRGSDRWRMLGLLYYQDFGRVEERTLVRIVFLDTVLIAGKASNQTEAVAFMREAFALPGDPVWRIIVGHSGVRSASTRSFTRSMLLDDLLPLTQELRVDLILSGNDRSQQVLNLPHEPLHVSTNGGGAKLETELAEQSTESLFVAVRPGFCRVTINLTTLLVEMLDRYGVATHQTVRQR